MDMHDEDDHNPYYIRTVKGRIPVVLDPLSNPSKDGSDTKPEDDRDEDDDIFEGSHESI